MLPWFEEKILEHKNGHLVVQDYSGAIVEISDQFDFSYLRSAKDFVTRKWHRFPLENRQDWEEKVKWRYDAHHPERFPADFDERCRLLKDRETVFQLTIPGPFWQLRDWIGLEPLCLMMVEQPEFIDELIEFWTDFVLATLKPILANVEAGLRPGQRGYGLQAAQHDLAAHDPAFLAAMLAEVVGGPARG